MHWAQRLKIGEVFRSVGEVQPDAETWFGCSLPTIVEDPHRGWGIRMVEHGNRDWWRGKFRRLRASAELAVWLYDWIENFNNDHRNEWNRIEGLARERLAQGINVAKLAATCGIDRNTFLRRLRAAGRGTPSEWIDSLREEEARRLLADRHGFVNNIATLCGFRSSSAFSRWFHKRTGQSPSAFRQSL